MRSREIEVSHTLGGWGEGNDQGRGKWRGSSWSFISEEQKKTRVRERMSHLN